MKPMYRIYRLLLISCYSYFILPLAHSTSINVEVTRNDQQVPLYQQDQTIVMQGYGINVAHTFSPQWSASISGHLSEQQENTKQKNNNQQSPNSNPWSADAKQQNISGALFYLLDDYLLSLEYNNLSFELGSTERVDLTGEKPLARYSYNEAIDSDALQMSISRDVDFDNSWLTFDFGAAYIRQQANFSSKITQRSVVKQLLSAENTAQQSDSWLLSGSVAWTSIWSWGDIAFVPSANLNYSSVVAGDNVYLLNTVSGASQTARRQRWQSEGKEPVSSDSVYYIGASLMVMLTDHLSCDLYFNRVYGEYSTDDYLALGVGWEF